MPRKKPPHLTDDEHVENLISRARKLTLSGNEQFEADWLVSGGIGSNQWVVVEDHNLNSTLTVRFDDYLPDGSLLTAPQNSLLLEPIQKAAFHLRMGNLQYFHGWHKQWLRVIDTSVNLSRWMVLNSSVFQTQQFGFQLLTDDHLKAYFHEFASGGIANTLKLDDRLLAILHEKTDSSLPLSTIFANKNCLDENFIQESAEWLNSQGAYIYSNQVKAKVVSRKYLEILLGCSSQLFDRYPIVANVINQFDIQHDRSSPEAVVPVPANKRRIVATSSIVRKTMYTHRKEIRIFTSAHNLVSEIPYISDAAFKEQHLDKLGLDGHTKLLPLEIGLGAINSAAEMIICYGEQIVEAAAAFADEYTYLRQEYHQPPCNIKIKEFFQKKKLDWPSKPEFGGIPLMVRYNAVSFTSNNRNTVNGEITFLTLQEAFYGACALLIGMCKPVRDGELHRLPLECLDWEFEGGGALLVQELEKSGLLGQRQQISRPIPSLVAYAIQLLQALSTKLRAIYQDVNGPLVDHLFYIPKRCLSTPVGKALGETLNAAIDTFCLISNLPRTKNGEPTKIRIHQMRKFFLIVMYKHHDSALRRTLGYGAGHIKEGSIDEYTTFSHDDPESVKYESQCVSDRLVAFELGQISPEGHSGLSALYSHVCTHFNVHTLQVLNNQSLINLLNHLQRHNTYKSTVYTVEITGPDGVLTTLEFAIKFEGEQDDEFN
ncbi:hypothetical protein [Pseudomonas hunanensis]|uniref:hypothetical protein n=1 Tax=Pseudomonas hunanensis TaxID=1247546 RepID=UPI0037F10AE4